jgi:poly-gamma-glutamate synthesis protein (capsule biosynthesis protein)
MMKEFSNYSNGLVALLLSTAIVACSPAADEPAQEPSSDQTVHADVETAAVSPDASTDSQEVSDGKSTLVFGGDVEWSPRGIIPPTHVFGTQVLGSRYTDAGSRRFPLIMNEQSAEFMQERFGRDVYTEASWNHYNDAAEFGFGGQEDVDPFENIADFFRDADLAFINRETPLSDTARQFGSFMTPTSFVNRLTNAGIDLISIANNHALDAEGQGMFDTMNTLDGAGIEHIGAGENLDAAAAPVIVELDGGTVGFIAFTYVANPPQTSIGFATPTRSGVAPLDRFLMADAIQKLHDQVDIVAISIHYGPENTHDVHPEDQELARLLVDAGADLVIGHHPHVPRGVEKYGDGLIMYSLGNLIFAHGHSYWTDNIVTQLDISNGQMDTLKIYSVSGKGTDVFQPILYTDERADEMLNIVADGSASLGTELTRMDNYLQLDINK